MANEYYKERTEKCCACGKDVVMKRDDIPATWFASYYGNGDLKNAIHADCSRKPENKDWFR